MELNSKELINAAIVPSSSVTTDNSNHILEHDMLEQLRNHLLNINKGSYYPFDMGSLRRIYNDSSNDCLKTLIHIIRDYYIIKFKEDNTKDLTSRKIFDTILLSLDCLVINKIDVSSKEINALIMGFLAKNFL